MKERASPSLPGIAVRRDGQRSVMRSLPEEEAIALVYDGTTQAVMMATPSDIEDFAVGFSLTEEFISAPGEIESFEIVETGPGIEVRMWLAAERASALRARQRRMAGPVGCGLCGIDSLSEALRALPVLDSGVSDLSRSELADATEMLRGHQPLHDLTHAAHAAGLLMPGKGIVLAREDVGRHNALDKLIGAIVRKNIDPRQGAIVLTSRVSVEMVQKCAIARVPVLIAASAPTAHAIRLAEGANLTLAAFARGGGFDLYSHPSRIKIGVTDVA